MPFHLTIGVSWERFMDSCPRELEPFLAAYKLQINREDIKQWQLGQYMAAAITCNFSKQKYPKKPIFQIKCNISHNSYKESQEEIAVFEMKQRINLLRAQGLPESPL